MKKLLIITPHLSTGGAPQVTANKIKLLKDDFIIKVVEHDFLAWSYVVQRNIIMGLVGVDNFHTLGENKYEGLKRVIDDFQPDVVSMEEIPEMFMNEQTSDFIYQDNHSYKIYESTHDSSFNVKNKKYFPNKFVFVSPYSAFQYMDLGVPIEIIEYPVDKKKQDYKYQKRELLGLDNNYKHIVIVGLFTPRKNQKYAFELAEHLYQYPVKFHFLGNLAGNFEFYWKPLLDAKESNERLNNCIIWDERSDVEDFLESSDMFLFCSKGERSNKELNPIAIKEAMEYDVPKFMYNLDVYCNKYNDYDNVHYLTGDLETDSRAIIDTLNVEKEIDRKKEEIIIVGTYPNLKERVKLTKECISRLRTLGRKIMLVSHYPVDFETQKLVDYYVYDAHNPLTHHSFYTRFYNYTNAYDAELNINALKNSNQSLTVLTNLYNGFKEAKNQGFQRAFYLTFDVLLDFNDIDAVNNSFDTITNTNKAYLATLNTPFGKGIQTNGMTFEIDFFISTFHDVRDSKEYNDICTNINCQNFLEDYFIKCLSNRHEKSYTLINNEQETFLLKSGLGTSSNSEYYSILPIDKSENEFMFYFFSYNLDERKVNITMLEDGIEFFNTRFQVNKCREYKKDFKFNGKPIDFILDFYDGDDLYKTEKYNINKANIYKFKETGLFKWKNQKPKIKVVHIQITLDDERQRQSRESISRVAEYGWEYVLHTNKPYSDLPPKYNCIRPNCVSLTLFDEQRVQEVGTALTPPHYGCYEAFKNALLSEFTNDVDYLMVCEGDCIIEAPINDFIENVEKSCQHILENNIGYISYGDRLTLEHGWLQSEVREEIPNQNLIYITDHIIGLQSIMFPSFASKYIKEQLRTHEWDASDMYFNTIMQKSSYKMAIVYDRMTTQADGFSLIDNTNKEFRKK